jgi:hypothetical protein
MTQYQFNRLLFGGKNLENRIQSLLKEAWCHREAVFQIDA